MFAKWFRLSLLLFVIWFLLSGRTEARFLITGAVCAAVIAFCCVPMLHTVYRGKRYYLLDIDLLRFFPYFFWLYKEIFFSSLDVMGTVLSPKKRIHSQLLRFHCDLEAPGAVVLFINSIILTPGTVTIDVTDENDFIVNALTDHAAEGLLSGVMQQKIARVFHEDLKQNRMKYRETGGQADV
ncbi:MAG: Na+/H+ antiporter subunit E [Eubacterium sp.]